MARGAATAMRSTETARWVRCAAGLLWSLLLDLRLGVRLGSSAWSLPRNFVEDCCALSAHNVASFQHLHAGATACRVCEALQLAVLCDARKAVGNDSYSCLAPLPGEPGRHVNCTVKGATRAWWGWQRQKGFSVRGCSAVFRHSAAPVCLPYLMLCLLRRAPGGGGSASGRGPRCAGRGRPGVWPVRCRLAGQE